MDILNWLFLKKQQLIKTEANNAATDLVVLGAEVPFTQRGDGYQDYAMSLSDAVMAGETENNTLRTGIMDDPYFFIGYPVMLKTSTNVIDTPSYPTMIDIDLQGWKIAGSVNVDEGNNFDRFYLGTVNSATSFWPIIPWKTTGTVFTYDASRDMELYTALSTDALIYDNDSNATIRATVYITTVYYGDEVDLYLEVDAGGSVEMRNTVISFEFEFLTDKAFTPEFIYYL